jgi:hypothetical protein
MVSLQRCRELLGCDGHDLSEPEIEGIREQILALARVALRAYSAKPLREFSEALAGLDSVAQEEVEERAAVMEFEGNMSRDQAERLALSLVTYRHKRPSG